MTYQDKLALIEQGEARIATGISWEAWEKELSDSGLYQKDINNAGVKVIGAIDERYGDAVEQELIATGKATPIDGLHESVFEKLVARRMQTAKAKLSRKISDDILAGKDPRMALIEHVNPLLDERVINNAVNRTNNRVAEIHEKQQNSNPVSLILGIIILVVGIGLTAASGGGAIFYGAILVGGSMIVKYLIA